MNDKITEFIYAASLQNRPKKLQNNVFVLFSPKRIKLRDQENCLFIHLNKLFLHAYFCRHLLKVNFAWKAINMSSKTTRTAFAMHTNSLTHHRKYILNCLIEVQTLFFQYAKKEELCFLTTLNDGVEELKVKYTKI